MSVTTVETGSRGSGSGKSALLASYRFVRRASGMLRVEAGAVRWLLATALLQTGFRMVAPWLFSQAVDEALPARAPRLLMSLVFLSILAAVCAEAVGWMHDKASVVLFQRLEAMSLEDSLRRFLGRPFQAIAQRAFGEASETMTAATQAGVFLTGAALTASTTLVATSLALLFLAAWFPGLAVAMVGVGGSMALVALGHWPRETRLAGETLEAACRQQQALHVLMKSLPSLRVANATGRAVSRWRSELSVQTRSIVGHERAGLSREVALTGIRRLSTVAVIAWLVRSIVQGTAGLGEMLMALVLIDMVMAGFSALLDTATSVQALGPYLQRLDDLVGEEQADSNRPPHFALRPAGGLALDRVWYRYSRSNSSPGAAAQRDDWVLVDATLQLQEGKRRLLVGPSGSGKTTKLRLLAGLIEPERGQVSVLGRYPSEVQHLIAYLPQQGILLNASIAENLRVMSGRSLEECLEVARDTGLATWLAELPMGADTLLSSGGGNVSAGQRQLVLLTAAFASARPVVLLDEPTSQLDALTKARIDWARLSRGKTVVMVSHDHAQEGDFDHD